MPGVLGITLFGIDAILITQEHVINDGKIDGRLAC
jgi:hypothetical protein